MPDLGLVPASPFFKKGGVDMGGFPTDPYGTTGPNMGGFPGLLDPYWGFVVLLNHWSGFDKQTVISSPTATAQNGWDSSSYQHKTNGTTSANGTLRYQPNPWGNATVEYSPTSGGGGAIQFGPAPELIIGTQDFCIEFQFYLDILSSGAGLYAMLGARNTGVTPTAGSWWFSMKNNANTTWDIIFNLNDVPFWAKSILPSQRPDIVTKNVSGQMQGTGWAHIVYCRQNGIGYVFLGDVWTDSFVDTNDYSANVGFGSPLATGVSNFSAGWLSEVRLTIGPNGSGCARYADINADTRQRGRWPEGYTL